MEDPIKQAFSKVKQDILNLQSEILSLKQETQELQRLIRTSQTSTHPQLTPTHQHQNFDTSTDKTPSEAPYPSNSTISTGNEGVSTDRQTIRQTDNTHQRFAQTYSNKLQESPQFPQEKEQKSKEISNAINNLEEIKASLKNKFKSLTNQEFLVLSTIYQTQSLSPEEEISYDSLAIKLKLTQSSIRDYVQRIINKGIPVDKTKVNNKKVILSISPDLKKLASLNTLLDVREAEKHTEGKYELS
jgi:DNA-binding MarR family transcriptional regulator